MTNKHSQQYEIGMVGLGVMGRNLLLNVVHHGFAVAGYDKIPGKFEALRQESKEGDVRGIKAVRPECTGRGSIEEN